MANFQPWQRIAESPHSLLSLAIMLARRADLKKAAAVDLAARLRPSFANATVGWAKARNAVPTLFHYLKA